MSTPETREVADRLHSYVQYVSYEYMVSARTSGPPRARGGASAQNCVRLHPVSEADALVARPRRPPPPAVVGPHVIVPARHALVIARHRAFPPFARAANKACVSGRQRGVYESSRAQDTTAGCPARRARIEERAVVSVTLAVGGVPEWWQCRAGTDVLGAWRRRDRIWTSAEIRIDAERRRGWAVA
ncbi:hypothetical protein CERSUDRAFT_101305 [Gelatoporia subvermispora B]|uniref:Uncharacterized protein n=1 Tax=Ceriporiopsis subvermispora (strain B) TaxID=914234 RepID=M2QER8_CERS8|nr:hypothetical protein CERSUDRAFT_101305 [Gelatoporia subvermispora B]